MVHVWNLQQQGIGARALRETGRWKPSPGRGSFDTVIFISVTDRVVLQLAVLHCTETFHLARYHHVLQAVLHCIVMVLPCASLTSHSLQPVLLTTLQ
jgi:hypothetical protein